MIQQSFSPEVAPTAANKLYPDFLLVGVMKAATTTVFDHLISHPKIVSPKQKELHYFSRDLTLKQPPDLWGMEYGELLNYGTGLKGALYGEASPSYIDVPERLYQFNSSCKIIIILRNPAHRALSHYFHNVFHKLENRPPFIALFAKSASQSYLRGYQFHSRYKDRLEKFLHLFPHKNICVMSFEYFIKNPQTSMDRIFEFLGLEKISIDTQKVSNKRENMAGHFKGWLKQRYKGLLIFTLKKRFKGQHKQVKTLLLQSVVVRIPEDIRWFGKR